MQLVQKLTYPVKGKLHGQCLGMQILLSSGALVSILTCLHFRFEQVPRCSEFMQQKKLALGRGL